MPKFKLRLICNSQELANISVGVNVVVKTAACAPPETNNAVATNALPIRVIIVVVTCNAYLVACGF